MSHWRHWDIALTIAILVIGMYAIPSLIEGIHNYRRGRAIARQLTREHEARKALEKRAR
jgi:ABC-type spermidine/putrescine transport system permease subunit I